MSKRLQVLVDEEEHAEIHDFARRRRLTVAEWVRQALREARRRELRRASRAKLEAIRRAVIPIDSNVPMYLVGAALPTKPRPSAGSSGW